MNSTGTVTVGRTRLFSVSCLGDYPFVVPDSHVSVVRTFDVIDSAYIYAVISSQSMQTYIEDNLAGSTNQKELYIGVLENMAIPLPPVYEQHRIAAELERCFSIIDTIDSSQSKLESNLQTAKSKILDLAISGKLVPQDPTDEPAIDLLKRINPAFVPCDNSHYENLPVGWTIATVSDVYEINPKIQAPDDSDAGFVPMANICNGFDNRFRSCLNFIRGFCYT